MAKQKKKKPILTFIVGDDGDYQVYLKAHGNDRMIFSSSDENDLIETVAGLVEKYNYNDLQRRKTHKELLKLIK